MANREYSVNDSVTVELYGKVIPGKVVAIHNPGDGYGQSVEIELSEAWRGGKKFWFQAEDVKPRAGLAVGDAVRIVGEEYAGQVGEIKVVEPDFYGVYLDSVEDTVFFLRDEIERVEDEQESACEMCGGLGEVREYPTGLFSLPAWKWVPCPQCSVVDMAELPF